MLQHGYGGIEGAWVWDCDRLPRGKRTDGTTVMANTDLEATVSVWWGVRGVAVWPVGLIGGLLTDVGRGGRTGSVNAVLPSGMYAEGDAEGECVFPVDDGGEIAP